MELRVNTFGPRAPGPTADPEFSALCKPLSCASRSVQAEECKAAEDQSLDVTRGSNSDFQKRGSKLPNSEMQQRVRSFSPGQQWAPGSGALGSPPPASPPAAFPLGSPEAKLETSAQPGTEQSHEADLHPRALLRDEGSAQRAEHRRRSAERHRTDPVLTPSQRAAGRGAALPARPPASAPGVCTASQLQSDPVCTAPRGLCSAQRLGGGTKELSIDPGSSQQPGRPTSHRTLMRSPRRVAQSTGH